jgi:hypothetical protein
MKVQASLLMTLIWMSIWLNFNNIQMTFLFTEEKQTIFQALRFTPKLYFWMNSPLNNSRRKLT